LEDSKLNPEENKSIESFPNLNEDNKDLNQVFPLLGYDDNQIII